MRAPTASSLELAETCPLSHVLPQATLVTPALESGAAVHEFLALAPALGRSAALARVPEAYRRRCEALDLLSLPLDPSSYAAEVAFAFDVSDGSAVELGRNIGRRYTAAAAVDEFDLLETVVFGTADVVALGPDFVLVDEYGGRSKKRASENLQAQFNAMAAARAYGRMRAVVRVTRIGDDGEIFRSSENLGAPELEVVRARVETPKQTKVAATEALLNFLRSSGAITTTVTTRVREHDLEEEAR